MKHQDIRSSQMHFSFNTLRSEHKVPRQNFILYQKNTNTSIMEQIIRHLNVNLFNQSVINTLESDKDQILITASQIGDVT